MWMFCFSALAHFQTHYIPSSQHSKVIANHTQICLCCHIVIQEKWAKLINFQSGWFWVLDFCRLVRSRISLTSSWFIFRLFTFFVFPSLALFIYFGSGMRPPGWLLLISTPSLCVSFITSIGGHAVAAHDAASSRPLMRRPPAHESFIAMCSNHLSSCLSFPPPSVALSQTITRLFWFLLSALMFIST